MTVERGQPAPPVDPQASLRTELVGQLAVAQLALEAAIAELSRTGGAAATIAASRLQLTSLISLRQQIGTATSSALAELRAEVTAAASSATSLAQQISGNASGAVADDATTRAVVARQSIEKVGREIFDEKVLDPFLQFSSEEDEKAYRKREQERKAALEQAKALHTSQGDHLALQIEIEQLGDAKAHGAERAPQFPALQDEIRQAKSDVQATAEKPTHNTPAGSKAVSADPIDDIMATLQAAGVESSQPKPPDAGHGLKLATNKPVQDGQLIRS